MTRLPSPADAALPAGFQRLIAAQFCSSLADNALPIVAIALLHARGQPAWLAPMLKFSTTAAYVLLAPWVGQLADAVPKARLMAWMNGLKVLSLLGLLAGLDPLACFALLGCGAAAYAPAKYGLVTELVPAAQLVRANAWIEVSVVGAVLLGTVCGGALVSEAFTRPAASARGGLASGTAPGGLWASMALLLVVYALAALVDSLAWALPMLACVGAVGGWLVVPMNALLQHRGQGLLSAGQSIAVQNFNENLGMLLMLASYAALLAWDPPIVGLMTALGGAVALGVLGLLWREHRRGSVAAAALALSAPA